MKVLLNNARFDGDTYDPKHDQVRLTGQILRIYLLMADGQWRTLNDICRSTHDPHASVSARLRDFRKDRFGKHTVNRRHLGDRQHGLWEYQLIVNERKPKQSNLF